MNIHSKRDLQNIAFNHSTGTDYKGFLKIYRNCTKEPYSFFTIDTRLLADDPMRFRKNFLDSPIIKMISNEQVKILDDKIKVNKAQYDLDRST